MNKYVITFRRADNSLRFDTEYRGYDLTHAVTGAKVALARLGENDLIVVSYVRHA